MTKRTKTFIIFILIPLVIGGLSALLTMKSMDIYSQINQPPFAPPAFLFPIVWTILYILMGVSSAIVYLKKSKNPDSAAVGLLLYGVSLLLNFFWSILFFNFRAFTFSFWWLAALWVIIFFYTKYFYKVSPIAGLLQIPYLLWVSFAGYLNFMISILN